MAMVSTWYDIEDGMRRSEEGAGSKLKQKALASSDQLWRRSVPKRGEAICHGGCAGSACLSAPSVKAGKDPK